MTRLPIAIAILLVPVTGAAYAQVAKAPAAKSCTQARATLVRDDKAHTGVHPLSKEPPANQYLTVLRSFDGCPVPVVLREDIGNGR